jgi:hypothetical protein
VGDEGFKNHPIGLGSYRFVSFQPGVEMVAGAAIGITPLFYFPGPNEEMRLKA